MQLRNNLLLIFTRSPSSLQRALLRRTTRTKSADSLIGPVGIARSSSCENDDFLLLSVRPHLFPLSGSTGKQADLPRAAAEQLRGHPRHLQLVAPSHSPFVDFPSPPDLL
jgi:hypothetical protein